MNGVNLEYKNMKELMIEEILNNTDLYNSKSELEMMSYSEVKSIYDSCMIPFLKKINNIKSKSK